MSLNTHLFTETGTDSGAINVLGTVVAPFEDVDTYRLDLFRDGEFLTHRTLEVSDDIPARQVDLDLGTLPELRQSRGHDHDCSCDTHGTLELGENGYLVLHVSQGPGDFAALAYRPDIDDEPAFDSRRLEPGAYFAATLLRPGAYVARNELGQGAFEFAVPSPEPPEGHEIPDEPVRATLTEAGFEADEQVVQPAQGFVFEVRTPARVVIELDEPADVSEGDRPNGRADTVARKPGSLFDPADHAADVIERKLRSVDSPGQLAVLRKREIRGHDRDDVKALIDARLQTLRGTAGDEEGQG